MFIFVTHDPRIALLSAFRIVMRNGGMQKVIVTELEELRVAEEIAMADVISNGRLEVGLVKGAAYEVFMSNRQPVRFMDRYWEAHDLIIKAWRDAFPNLFTDGSKMPDEIRAHLRYPEDLVKAQGNIPDASDDAWLALDPPDAYADTFARVRLCVSGASALNARMCVNKAYTAVKWLRDTKVLKERMFDMSLGDDRRDIAWFGDPRFTAVWGGILLRAPDGTVLGALGESGGSPAQDEEIGQIGARVFAGL